MTTQDYSNNRRLKCAGLLLVITANMITLSFSLELSPRMSMWTLLGVHGSCCTAAVFVSLRNLRVNMHQTSVLPSAPPPAGHVCRQSNSHRSSVPSWLNFPAVIHRNPPPLSSKPGFLKNGLWVCTFNCVCCCSLLLRPESEHSQRKACRGIWKQTGQHIATDQRHFLCFYISNFIV